MFLPEYIYKPESIVTVTYYITVMLKNERNWWSKGGLTPIKITFNIVIITQLLI